MKKQDELLHKIAFAVLATGAIGYSTVAAILILYSYFN